MSIRDGLLPHTVTVLRPTVAADRRGDQQESFTAPTTFAGVRAFVQPTPGNETTTDPSGDRVRSFARMISNFQVQPHDHVVYDGLTYLVDSDPVDFSTPAGYHHTTARLLLITG